MGYKGPRAQYLVLPPFIIGTLLGIGAAVLFNHFVPHEGEPFIEAGLVMFGSVAGFAIAANNQHRRD
jgi:uncharacterized membrane protein YccC